MGRARLKVGQVIRIQMLTATAEHPYRKIVGRFYDTRSSDFSITPKQWVYRISGDAGDWGELELRPLTKRERGQQ